VRGHVDFAWRDLAVALVLGIVAGAFAHLFARVMRIAKSIAKRAPLAARIPIAGGLMAGIVLLASTIADGGTILGPGYVVTRWALDPTHSVGIILGMLLLRTAASAVTLAGGGVGGLFIPLVAAGALTGRAVGGATGHAEDPLYAVVGAAAFLAAGYRVPLAAITFVAETTGRAGFIVPAMVAAFAAEITMGTTSVSAEQRDDAEAGW
jgi:CIC family chloride channel protein